VRVYLFLFVSALGHLDLSLITPTSYALQWLIALPLEIISASIVTTYWNSSLNKAVFVTIFLAAIVGINLCGVKGYGEAEFIFAIIKVIAVIGFM
jgi:yeast amino acid transporter